MREQSKHTSCEIKNIDKYLPTCYSVRTGEDGVQNRSDTTFLSCIEELLSPYSRCPLPEDVFSRNARFFFSDHFLPLQYYFLLVLG